MTPAERILTLVFAFAVGAVLTLLVGCAPAAWRSVPANCAVEYDTRSRIVASYCEVP